MLSLGNTTWRVKAMLALCRTRLASHRHHHDQGQSSHYHHHSCSYHQRLTSPRSSAPDERKRGWGEVSPQTPAQPVHPKRAGGAHLARARAWVWARAACAGQHTRTSTEGGGCTQRGGRAGCKRRGASAPPPCRCRRETYFQEFAGRRRQDTVWTHWWTWWRVAAAYPFIPNFSWRPRKLTGIVWAAVLLAVGAWETVTPGARDCGGGGGGAAQHQEQRHGQERRPGEHLWNRACLWAE